MLQNFIDNFLFAIRSRYIRNSLQLFPVRIVYSMNANFIESRRRVSKTCPKSKLDSSWNSDQTRKCEFMLHHKISYFASAHPDRRLYQSIVRLLSVRESKAHNWIISCYGYNRETWSVLYIYIYIYRVSQTNQMDVSPVSSRFWGYFGDKIFISRCRSYNSF